MNIIRRTLAMSVVLGAAVSCATPSNYVPQTTQISFPQLNTPHSVAIGEEMLKQGTSTLTRGIQLSEQNRIGVFEFNPGFYPQVGEDKDHTYHSIVVGNPGNGIGWLRIGGILPGGNSLQSLRASKKEQQLCAVSNLGTSSCDTEHGYVRTERPMVSEGNFQQTLIYNGRVGNRIKIGYREFAGGMARAPFSNEVEYDLNDSMEITYRGARLRILDANNQQIRYVVLSNFNTPS